MNSPHAQPSGDSGLPQDAAPGTSDVPQGRAGDGVNPARHKGVQGADPGRERPAAVRPVTVPWIRVRLRTAPQAALALMLLVAFTACLAAAFPRAVDRYEDAGLRGAVRQIGPAHSTVQVTAPPPSYDLTPAERAEAVRPGELHHRYLDVLTTVTRPLAVDEAQSAYGAATAGALPVPEPWIPRPSGLPAQVSLIAQSGLVAHSVVREGRPPRADGPVTERSAEVEAAVTADTAESMHIRTGSVLHVPRVGRPPLAVRVTGVLTPRAAADAYWSTRPLMHRPTLVSTPSLGEPQQYWLGALLLPPGAAPALLALDADPYRYWNLAPGPDGMHARGLDGLRTSVAALTSGPGGQLIRDIIDPATEVNTDLDDAFDAFETLRSGIAPLVAVAVLGTATVAGVVLFMAGGLGADRRRAELTLLRARGASLRGLTARLCAETAVLAVPAGALGLAAALLAVPGGRFGPAALAALAVTVAACAALPLYAAVAHRSVRVTATREDAAHQRPSRRRTVAELTLLVLAAAAVEALRRHGTADVTAASDASTGTTSTGNPLVSVAPVLVGVIAALVLSRLHPPLLRGLAGPAARLRGAVGHLSLARMGRTRVAAALPLLALLTALTTAAFGGSVLAGIADARDRAALLSVGADARVDSEGSLPAGLAGRVRATDGARQVTALGIDHRAQPEDGDSPVPVVGVDPDAYAALTARTGLGAFEARRLRHPAGTSGALPALASPSVARTQGVGHAFPVRLSDDSAVTVRIVAVRDLTPALPGSDFLVVDRAGLGAAARTTTLLVTGERLDGAALRRTVGASATVDLRTEERAEFADSPLQSGGERIYTAAVVAGAGYALLALLLALSRAAPERTALLARLRVLGLGRAQGRRLLILESLPQAVLAALGGTLTGWAAIRLLAPGVDLGAIALAARTTPAEDAALRADALSLAVPAALVLAVTVGVAAAQAWWSGRRGSVTELRAGDTP